MTKKRSKYKQMTRKGCALTGATFLAPSGGLVAFGHLGPAGEKKKKKNFSVRHLGVSASLPYKSDVTSIQK